MNDDPFAPLEDPEATIIRPNPGGMNPTPPSLPTPRRQTPSSSANPQALKAAVELLNQGAMMKSNPLVSQAVSIILLAIRLRTMPEYAAVDTLYRDLAERIRLYAERGLASGLDAREVRVASYGLCAFIDEAVLATPWGSRSFWAHQSLLVKFHGDTWGGEKVFDFITSCLSQPSRHQQLIGFFWILITLGFKGKFGVIDQGSVRLDAVRNDLYGSMEVARGARGLWLSDQWRGLTGQPRALLSEAPAWTVIALAVTLMLTVYLAFLFMLSKDSESAARKVYAYANSKLALPAPALPPPIKAARAERFRRILASDIAANRVEVIDDRLIRIRDSFASGSDRIKPEFIPMLSKIAEELADGGDRVLVTGHTDSQPIFSAKFPSNFDLSMSRANHVAQMLRASSKKEGLIHSEGRADFEPLVIEDSPKSRAVNRRVDIQIQ